MSRSNDAVDFAPVQVIGSGRDSHGAIEIVLGTGERVVVPPGVSPEFLRQVLTALR